MFLVTCSARPPVSPCARKLPGNLRARAGNLAAGGTGVHYSIGSRLELRGHDIEGFQKECLEDVSRETVTTDRPRPRERYLRKCSCTERHSFFSEENFQHHPLRVIRGTAGLYRTKFMCLAAITPIVCCRASCLYFFIVGNAMSETYYALVSAFQ